MKNYIEYEYEYTHIQTDCLEDNGVDVSCE